MRAYDITSTVKDLRHLRWSETMETSGTGGTFLKASEGQGTGRVYYKLSCYDSYRGIYGHECVNEIVAARLMGLMGIPHVRYQLVHAQVVVDGREHTTWLCRSNSYRKSTERKIAFDTFYRNNAREDERPLDLCDRLGWGQRVRQMMLADYLIANRDRHGANIEVIRGNDGAERLAPLFDNGVSFVFSCYGDEGRAARFDVMEDIAANNFIGTRSLEENLRFVTSARPEVSPVQETCREPLFRGLDSALPRAHHEAMWNMIWNRWQHYAAL